jgi:hypothetical protein
MPRHVFLRSSRYLLPHMLPPHSSGVDSSGTSLGIVTDTPKLTTFITLLGIAPMSSLTTV